MLYNFLKIRTIQLLLNLNKNLKYIFISFLSLLFLFTFSTFGFWNLLSGYYHLTTLIALLAFMIFILIFYKRKLSFISIKSTIVWLESKNYTNINPLSAIKDIPAGDKTNLLMWDAHIKQTKASLKDLVYYFPKITLEAVDPLKVRFIFILFFILSIFWGLNNNVLKQNLVKIYVINLNKVDKLKEKYNVLARLKPPAYTMLPQRKIEIKNFNNEETRKINVPFSSELLLQTFGESSKKMKITIDKKNEYYSKDNDNLNINYKLMYSQNLKIETKDNTEINIYLNIIEDEKPEVKFLSNPEVVNGVSLKFLTEAKDDYGIVKGYVTFTKPFGFEHFIEKQLRYDLPVSKDNKNLFKSMFFKNMSSHIWAGNNSNININFYDDLDQKGTIYKNIFIPEKKFTSLKAKLIYEVRTDLAKRKISLYEAKKIIDNIILEEKDFEFDELIKEKYFTVISKLNELKKTPISYKSSFYKDLWELAIAVEEGEVFSVKKNLEQIEQNLFDSINQRETEKVSTNVDKFKESIQSLLDINKQDRRNSFSNNENNIKEQLKKATKDLEDLLKTGTKENLDEKVQELRQLADSIKNPKKLDKNQLFKEQKKREFINKLSELLNEQELIMEETFNEAANRGKFKQSSEGSGGRTSKERQENLRNTLGNIMRDIGESENEIPQELGRADRAMRQATRELEGGRPDQASNAQGRATEMLRRGMERMRYNNNFAQNSSSQKENNIENQYEKNFSDSNNNLEYQGTSLGGTIEIPKKVKIQKAQKIAKELYTRYNQKGRSIKEKEYIKNLLDWY